MGAIEREKRSTPWVMGELITLETRQSLEGLGLNGRWDSRPDAARAATGNSRRSAPARRRRGALLNVLVRPRGCRAH